MGCHFLLQQLLIVLSLILFISVESIVTSSVWFFSVYSLFSVSFIFVSVLIISFLQLTLGLVCSFCSSLTYKVIKLGCLHLAGSGGDGQNQLPFSIHVSLRSCRPSTDSRALEQLHQIDSTSAVIVWAWRQAPGAAYSTVCPEFQNLHFQQVSR